MENINVLAEKIYQEGIQKAQIEAEELINKSQREAAEIIAKAKKEAAEIIEKGKSEAENHEKILQSEVRLSVQHTLEELKNKVRELIIFQALNKPTGELFSDPKFLAGLFMEMAKNLDAGKGFVVKISSELDKEMAKRLESEVGKTLKDVNFEIDTRLGSKSFRIGEKGKNFEISFSEEDFVEFFQSQLKERTRKLLFD